MKDRAKKVAKHLTKQHKWYTMIFIAKGQKSLSLTPCLLKRVLSLQNNIRIGDIFWKDL